MTRPVRLFGAAGAILLVSTTAAAADLISDFTDAFTSVLSF